MGSILVLERLISLKAAIKNPLWVFVIGGIISVICLFVSFVIFHESVGLFTSLLVTIAVTPLMVNLIRYEESKDELDAETLERMNILQRHRDVLRVYTAFFCGMILSLSIVYLMMPVDVVEKLFEDQIREINVVRGMITFGGNFQKIIINNLGVLSISFLLSFLFGAGAIFILAWNASVLSTAIGIAARTIGGVKGLPLAVLMFFPHGSLEILAYFIGAISGGLISTAITRKESPKFMFILKDTCQLVAVSVLILAIAAAVESVQLSYLI